MRGQHGLSLTFNTLKERIFKDIENLPDALKKAAKQINGLELDTSKPQTISTYLAWQENANKILSICPAPPKKVAKFALLIPQKCV